MYRYINVMRRGQKYPVLTSPLYTRGEQIGVISEEMAKNNSDLTPGLYFEILGKDFETGEDLPVIHLPVDGDEIYVVQLMPDKSKVTIAHYQWPLEGSNKEVAQEEVTGVAV